jgi:hypothetical protein
VPSLKPRFKQKIYGMMHKVPTAPARWPPREQGTTLCSTEVTMPLVQVVLALIVVGVLLWLINTFVPMAGSIKSILNAVVVICVVVWLLNVFGLMGPLYHLHVPPLRQ